MDFHWVEKDNHQFELIGYYDSVIATLYWYDPVQCWVLESRWLNMSKNEEFAPDYDEDDIESVKKEALRTLMEHCEEQIVWFEGQKKMLQELQDKE